MATKTGFVVLQGRKILITVRDGNTSHWVSARAGQDGPRLTSIERALKKVRGAREKLLDGKMQAV
jgi:hypothetical protein